MRTMISFVAGVVAMTALFGTGASAQGLLGSKEQLGEVVAARDAHESALKGEMVIVDVRSSEEWKETGVPASGFAITMHQDAAIFLNGLDAAMGGDRTKPLALICATGSRTTYLQKPLQQMGFTRVMNVAEGMQGGRFGDGWVKGGLPVRKWAGAADTGPVSIQTAQ